jgi:hypothetical protein
MPMRIGKFYATLHQVSEWFCYDLAPRFNGNAFNELQGNGLVQR